MSGADTRTPGPCCAPAPHRRVGELPAVARARTPLDHDLVCIPGGVFAMGADDGPHPEDGEGPVRQVTLSPFTLSPVTVTNAAFAIFVNDTGYETLAERQGYSFVFAPPSCGDQQQRNVALQTPWWQRTDGACWRWPSGPSGPRQSGRQDHPVAHIALPDALAYCHWSGSRLPTEAEWECAARGGLTGAPFPWGDDLEPDGERRAHVWQGVFPQDYTGADGHAATAPVRLYKPNAYGLYAMTGNVWEWTGDRFTALHSPRPVKDPTGPLNGARYVARGGSFLCHASYCLRYRTSSRQALDPLTTAENIGFRVAGPRVAERPMA